MKKTDVKISYDAEADVLSWEASRRGKIDYASEVGNFIVHFTRTGLPVLIEVLDASRILKKTGQMMGKARGQTVRDA